MQAMFGAEMARFYQDRMVPMIFEPYAGPMAVRAAAAKPGRVLEIAAGTGAVTLHLARLLAGSADIVATDVSPEMLAVARLDSDLPVTWMPADAHALPFDDGVFDVVVCQFGAMFFADRRKAYAEVLRVLRPQGVFLFSTWGSLAENEFVGTVNAAVAELLPDRPPRFLSTVPHGYHDHGAITADLAVAGFTGPPSFEQVEAISTAPDALHVATAYCLGTPLRAEIEAAGAIKHAEAALIRRFGNGPVASKTLAHFITVRR